MLFFIVRAKEKLEELDRLLEIAKKNYTQLGGRLSEDRKRLQEIRDKDKLVIYIKSWSLCEDKSIIMWNKQQSINVVE